MQKDNILVSKWSWEHCPLLQILPELVQILVHFHILVHVQNLGACVCALDLAARAQIVRKKKKNQTKFASRHLAGHATPKRFQTALSFRDFVFKSISKATRRKITHSCPLPWSKVLKEGGVIGLGVCCIFSKGGRANAVVKPRYFLPHPSYVCRQETKPSWSVFSPKYSSLP